MGKIMIHETGKPPPSERRPTEEVKFPSRWTKFRKEYGKLSKGMQIVVAILITAIAVLAFPAWGIESIIRKQRPGFEFAFFSATPYFFFVAVIAALGIVATKVAAIQVIALYLLTLMELISLSVCMTIAVISPGRLQTLNRMVAIRSLTPRIVVANRSTVYAAVASACYAIYFFGILSYALWEAGPSYFGGVSEPSTRLYSFWQFIQNSFLTLTNAGGTLISRRFLSQLIGDFERIVGIFLLVFLLSVLASGWAERTLKRATTSTPPENNLEEHS
jgi:hypothetical protein